MEEINPLSLDSEEILQYKLDDQFHIWPLVRFDLLTALSRQGTPGASKHNVSIKTRVVNLLRGTSGIRLSRVPVQFISSTRFCVKQSDTYTNVLEDYFCQVFPSESFVYENLDPLDYSRRLPRKNSAISTVFTYVDLLGKALAKLSRASSDGDIDAFCDHLIAKGVPPELVGTERIKLFGYAKQLKAQKFFYRAFLKLCAPRLLFVNCGAYGASNAILISEAKALGIRIAEMQHGVIDTSHYAYNYSEEIKNSSVYSQYMPDYMLTFGEFWHGCMNNSCVKVSVGHPHLSKIREQFVDKPVSGSFLVISQWTITDELIEATLKIRQAFPDAKIRYRLHPAEVLDENQKRRILTNNIEVADSKTDIYSEFSHFEHVVGCYSTALYEAKAFGKKILVMSHPLAFRYGFDKVGVLMESPLVLNAESFNRISGRSESSYFYQIDFDKSYRKFVCRYAKEARTHAC